MTLVSARPTSPKPLHFTPADYQRLGQSGVFADRRVELIEGVIIAKRPIGRKHWVTTNLVVEKLEQVFTNGYFTSVQNPVYLEDSEPEPDVAVFRGSPRDYTDPQSSAVPELIVEVADMSLEYDRIQKSRVYARALISEYWIVDPNAGTVEVRRQPDASGIYASVAVKRRGETIAPLAQSDTSVLVDDLLP